MRTIANEECVVTGGAGAIGSRLVRCLLAEREKRVQVIDNLSSGCQWLLPEDPRVELVNQDVAKLVEAGPGVNSALVFDLQRRGIC